MRSDDDRPGGGICHPHAVQPQQLDFDERNAGIDHLTPQKMGRIIRIAPGDAITPSKRECGMIAQSCCSQMLCQTDFVAGHQGQLVDHVGHWRTHEFGKRRGAT